MHLPTVDLNLYCCAPGTVIGTPLKFWAITKIYSPIKTNSCSVPWSKECPSVRCTGGRTHAYSRLFWNWHSLSKTQENQAGLENKVSNNYLFNPTVIDKGLAINTTLQSCINPEVPSELFLSVPDNTPPILLLGDFNDHRESLWTSCFLNLVSPSTLLVSNLLAAEYPCFASNIAHSPPTFQLLLLTCPTVY